MLAEDDATDGFGEDPDRGAEHDDGFDEGGEGFDFSVAVVVGVVGGAVGDVDGDEGDGGGDEIDAGVGGFGEHAERSGEESGEEFAGNQGDGEGGEDREKSAAERLM